ncbi:MAG: hypothetical protein OCD02_06320 [Spirochaetaceae bacterium]
MKKTLLFLVLLTGCGLLLSASSNKEEDVDYRNSPRGGMRFDDKDGRGRGMSEDDHKEMMEEFLENSEIVTVTGPITLINDEFPTIDSDGVVFTIVGPVEQLLELEVKDGMTVTIEGVETNQRRLQWDGKEKTLMLTKAIIDGKEIEIDLTDMNYGYMGNMGGRRGPKGHRGGRSNVNKDKDEN